MPDGTGIDVIKEVQKRGASYEDYFYQRLSRVFLCKGCLAFGAVDYLVKPIEKNLLLEAVHKAMSHAARRKQ